MKNALPTGTFLILASLATCRLWCPLSVAAQDDPPPAEAAEDEDPEAEGDPAADDEAAVDPFGAPAGNAQRVPAPTPTSSDPVVQAVVQTNPQTPAELLRATRILLSVNHASSARPLVERLVAANLDQAALTALAEEYGPALLLKMSLASELAPVGKQFADAALAAAAAAARNPAELTRRLGQLSDPSYEVRGRALAELQEARGDGLATVVTALIDPARVAKRADLQTALRSWGDPAPEVVATLLTHPDPAARVVAAKTLAQLNQPAVAVWLLAPALSAGSSAELREAARAALVKLTGEVPNVNDAAADLYALARERLLGRPATTAPVRFWRWDAIANRPVAEDLSPRQANVQSAVALAAAAGELLPDSPTIRQLHLTAWLEAVPSANSDAASALPPQALGALDAQGLLTLLEQSMLSDQIRAATRLASLLGEARTADVLRQADGQISPLVAALKHPDRQLRFAALEAVLKHQPRRSFAGASYVVEALAFFLRTEGADAVLIAAPQAQEATRLAGLVAAAGRDVQALTTARSLLAAATSLADAELCLVDFSLASPTSGQLLQQLRRDARTAHLPIGILCGLDDLQAGERLARRYPGTLAVVRPHQEAALAFEIAQVLEAAGREVVSVEERLRQAGLALKWVAELIRTPQDPFEVARLEPPVIDALWVPGLQEPATDVLAALGTRESQRALVDMASQGVQPMATRQTAASALAASLAQHGTLLSSGEISRQYERYNLTERQSRDDQVLMGQILDLIEARAVADTRSTPDP